MFKTLGGGTINICYIKSLNYIDEILSNKHSKLPYFIKWLIYNYKKIFKIFTIKNVGEKRILILPTYNLEKSTQKWMKYLNSILFDNNINTVVLSKTIKKIPGIKEGLNKENINILEGKLLRENLLIKIIEYISNEINEDIANLEITLLINEYKKPYVESIIALAEKTKNLKLVTNNVDDFKNLEQKLQELFGILIRVTNNKRKSLAKSRIIINIDFPEELVNKYSINPDAIIVNIDKPVKIKAKKFAGINVHNVKLYIPHNCNVQFEENNVFNVFSEEEMYEAELINLTFEEAQKKLAKDKIYIKNLIGANGVISKHEFKSKIII